MTKKDKTDVKYDVSRILFRFNQEKIIVWQSIHMRDFL